MTPRSNPPNDIADPDDDDALSIASDDEDDGNLQSSKSEDHSAATGTDNGGDASSSGDSIARKESDQVFRLRLLVLLAILLAAVAVSLAVYFLTANSEKHEFEQQFEGASRKILTSFEEIVNLKLSAIGSLAVQASMYVNNHVNISWPFVTIPDFQLRAAVARELSGSLFVRIVPVVVPETRAAWEKYSVENVGWIGEAQAYNKANGVGFDRRLEGYAFGSGENGVDFSSGIGDKIYGFDETFTPAAVAESQPYLFPLWQESPTFGRDITNFDTLSYPDYAPYIAKAYEAGAMSIGGLDTAPPGNTTHPNLSTSYFSLLESINAGEEVYYNGDPMSSVFLPVFDDYQAVDRKPVAMVLGVFKWAFYFEDLLPPHFPGLVLVLQNNCDGAFTYKVVGENVEYLGEGDLHETYTRRPDMVRSVKFDSENDVGAKSALGVKLNQDLCAYEVFVYPSTELEDEYLSWLPLGVTCAVAVVFLVTAVVFLIFNKYVERRQTLVMDQAVKSTAIVTSLFPAQIRDRLMNSGEFASGKNRLKSFLNDNNEDGLGQPIADLFPHCTVFFADISGFTAWSSTRDPGHVFLLLETVYQDFDRIARLRNVFKVETIGDSYVAVTGLPNANEKHALVMARFAGACVVKFNQLTNSLEQTLGPDTGDLGLRVGLHSGPVTAGVLRGERARFQLFGDTVNTAARMESSGKPNQIQCTEATANLLVAAGKDHWIQRREDSVNVKGKGVLESYFIKIGSKGGSSEHSEAFSFVPDVAVIDQTTNAVKQERLVKWITDLFVRRIETIVARQDPDKAGRCSSSQLVYRVAEGATSLDEVAEVIKLPTFNEKAAARAKARGKVNIPMEIVSQLYEIVGALADMYKANPFHNFEHACHVTMAVDKFMNRIVTPDMDESVHETKDRNGIAAHIHEYTHGINSDPITLLAIVFSALIHDTDHRGVSNMQLAKEDEQMAALYNNKSIAEQNSLDLAWELLMRDKYAKLRAALFVNREEMMRFRQVVVNVVLATDIFDKELNDLRKSRWNRAFSGGEEDALHNDLRATIVIEHIIQASDVSHTMQHWHIYRKWNERLFKEMWIAFKQGRMGKSPADFWYKGELGFFDNYIIPLAKKLKECNVFGVSSDECLNYAMRNRQEWEERGMEVTNSMTEMMQGVDVPLVEDDIFQDEITNELEC